MSKKIFLFISIIFISCSPKTKYEMPNMLGGENIDVTDLVVTAGFKPVYDSTKNICALINPNPIKINITYESKLKEEFKRWLVEKNCKFDTVEVDKISLLKYSKYQYTYLITYNPVDVYRLEVKINSNVNIAYFRMEKGGLILPFKDEGWVIPSPITTTD
jgi:hypothetical protein